MISELVHARHLAELGLLQGYLDNAGVQTNMIEKSDIMPLHVLVAALKKDHKGRDRYVNFSFVPISEDELEHIRLLQLYTTIPCDLKPKRKEQVAKLLLAVNSRAVIGHFSIKEDDEIYFRYVHCIPNGKVADEEPFIETVSMFNYMIDLFSERINDVADGKELAEALADLD